MLVVDKTLHVCYVDLIGPPLLPGTPGAAIESFDISSSPPRALATIELSSVGTNTSGPYRRCHDITSDSNGNLYVTDIGAGLIWKVDSKKHVTVWSDDPIYKLNPTALTPFTLSGIKLHPKSFFWVLHYSSSLLLKVPIKSDGKAGKPVIIADHTILNQPNAIEFLREDKVLINDISGVYTLTTKDEWAGTKLNNVDVSGKWHPPSYSPMSLYVKETGKVYSLISDLPKFFRKTPSSDFHIYTLTTEIPHLYDGIGHSSDGWIAAVVILVLVALIAILIGVFFYLQAKKAQQHEMP